MVGKGKVEEQDGDLKTDYGCQEGRFKPNLGSLRVEERTIASTSFIKAQVLRVKYTIITYFIIIIFLWGGWATPNHACV